MIALIAAAALAFGQVELGRVTAYNAVPEQTTADPTMSSCGPTFPGQIALSRDLFFDEHGNKHLCGAEAVIVLDSGVVITGIVNDTMAARWRLSADILMDSEPDALAFGVQAGVLSIREVSYALR